MKIRSIRTRLFAEGEDIVQFILGHVPSLSEDSVLVVTSKIVALSESRTATPQNPFEMEDLVRAESEFAIPTEHVWLTVKDGMFVASAGIDESNANGKCILLPKDSFRAARRIQLALKKACGLTHLGVLITDSRVVPLRAGTTGVALGYAGFCGLKDYRGMADLFGRVFRFSTANIADALAAAAVLEMGEGDERRPLAIIDDAPIEWRDRADRKELRIDIQDDMYRPLFGKGLILLD